MADLPVAKTYTKREYWQGLVLAFIVGALLVGAVAWWLQANSSP